MIVATALLRPERLKHMDFLHPYYFSIFSMLMPMPQVTSLNMSAVWKPFQIYVLTINQLKIL